MLDRWMDADPIFFLCLCLCVCLWWLEVLSYMDRVRTIFFYILSFGIAYSTDCCAPVVSYVWLHNPPALILWYIPARERETERERESLTPTHPLMNRRDKWRKDEGGCWPNEWSQHPCFRDSTRCERNENEKAEKWETYYLTSNNLFFAFSFKVEVRGRFNWTKDRYRQNAHSQPSRWHCSRFFFFI